MTPLKAFLRHRLAGWRHDEYQRVATDNVVMRARIRQYETALSAATVDLQELKTLRSKALRDAAEFSAELAELQGVHARVLRQRDNAIGQRDAAWSKLREFGVCFRDQIEEAEQGKQGGEGPQSTSPRCLYCSGTHDKHAPECFVYYEPNETAS